MAVNLSSPNPDLIFAVRGVRLGVACAGIRKADRKDLLVISLAEGSQVAGVFTQNRFRAAPVVLAASHLEQTATRAMVVNTGCANAGTGEEGIARAMRVCREVGRLLDCDARAVLPFSTGVIMEHLPDDRIAKSLPQCIEALSEDGWLDAAEAIMTTDIVPKAVSRKLIIGGCAVTVTGIAKGSGMIRPNLATMLAFVATDAVVPKDVLQCMVEHATQRSFNCVTVDGDTSTNDSLMMVATGLSQCREIAAAGTPEYALLLDAVTNVCVELAQMLVRDGEGATKFITVRVENGRSENECRAIAYSIAQSPLVKTAFYAADPNLGRILAAIGYSGIEDLDVTKLDVYLGDVLVVTEGSRAPDYLEEVAQRIMDENEFTVRVLLNRGTASATIWTCDLSHQYVTINADYRS
jgi:glutamate N-acetyltransferase/amino-acid N-acetyltransferase